MVVVDIADVGFIHAHAKRDRGANNRHFAIHKCVLSGDALLGFHTRMIGLGVESCLDKALGDLFSMAL